MPDTLSSMLKFGLIYTVGDTHSYRQALDASERTGVPLYKVGRGIYQGKLYDGGIVWRTREAAQQWLNDNKKADRWSVWGVDADWTTEEVSSLDQEPARLLHNRPVIDLYA